MALAATFLSGAKSRLLPASVPFRYFGAALAFHLLAWLLVLLGAPQVPSFAGGLGAPLGALHAVTLGVLLMTAMLRHRDATRQTDRKVGGAGASRGLRDEAESCVRSVLCEETPRLVESWRDIPQGAITYGGTLCWQVGRRARPSQERGVQEIAGEMAQVNCRR